MNNKTLFFILLAVFIFVVGIGYALFYKGEGSPLASNETVKSNQDLDDEESNPDSKDKNPEIKVKTEDNPGEGIVATVVAIPAPNLERPTVFNDGLNEDERKKMQQQINDISALLRQDSSLFSEWLDLGLLWKAIGDYEGAKEAWEYASVLRPQNSLSFANLGVLYGYYLKSPQKAEEKFLKSIDNDRKMAYLYIQTADFYKDVLKDTAKARGIIEKGIKENPGEEALKAVLSNL